MDDEVLLVTPLVRLLCGMYYAPEDDWDAGLSELRRLHALLAAAREYAAPDKVSWTPDTAYGRFIRAVRALDDVPIVSEER